MPNPFAIGVIYDLKKIAEKRGIPFHAYQLMTKDVAQNAPTIWTTFGLFYNGIFMTHEIPSANKFEKNIKYIMNREFISLL
ncbi:YoaP domain-containing protein [Lysinibacillus xylanilyticus]|uniref:YoaP domain-containing protein n=1 Tax=Lysinibacillus xylanilyticus TaxID=582475 RepID=UPI0038154A6D